MREILFRAKNLYSNEWVDGFLVASKCNTYPDGFEMITYQGINRDELDDYQPDFLSFHVDPETIGQFTGLTDKNGKKIFEGDVVKIQIADGSFRNASIDFRNGYFTNSLSTYLGGLVVIAPDCEVIGNIHDNPELLENP